VKPVTLTLTEVQLRELHLHLFPGDGCEAIAFLLCGRRDGARHRLSVRRVVPIPYELCSVRAPDRVTWPTKVLEPVLAEAAKRGEAVIKIHGHDGYDRFSGVDDQSDRALFPSLYCWLGDDQPLGSAILLKEGRVFGRICDAQGHFHPIDRIAVVGDDIQLHDHHNDAVVTAAGHRVAQTFGKATFAALRRLRIGVVGCSGTGSPVVEMLARNCVGALVLVDPDVVEDKNLNRILNTTSLDAEVHRPKVEVLTRAVRAIGLGTEVDSFHRSLFNEDVVYALADCDVIFGCMDSVDGRHLLNRLASFYSIPYFDLGVRLEADGLGGINQVAASVHYLKPGGSSLLSRRVYTLEQLSAAGLARTDPATYQRQLKEGYIRGVAEDRPAVIHVNTLIASLAVNEFLARIHPFRIDPNGDFAVRRISLSHNIFTQEDDGEQCPALARHVGRGDVQPLLDWPELSRREAA
jgi:hypothetical protein